MYWGFDYLLLKEKEFEDFCFDSLVIVKVVLLLVFDEYEVFFKENLGIEMVNIIFGMFDK